MLTAVTLGSGAIVGTVEAWPYVEPYLVAHRGYVAEQVGGVRTTVGEVLIWKAEDARNKIKADISGWNIQLQKEQDPQTRALIERQLEQLASDQKQNDERLRKLRGQ